jgi:DNA-binding phage protein
LAPGEQYRVLFYVDGDGLVLVHAESRRGTMVLVHGIHKKTQKTPAATNRARADAHEGRNMKKQAKDELEEMFEELGELEDVRALTRKKLLADALQKAMKKQKVTPAEMARRMGTSRPTVYRLLDPAERGATLDTLERASRALGLDLEIKLVRGRRPKGRRAA